MYMYTYFMAVLAIDRKREGEREREGAVVR